MLGAMRSHPRPLRLVPTVLAALALAGAALAQPCAADAALVPIPEVQGSERRSPLVGEVVTVEGVVTAVFTGRTSPGGVFLQDPGGDGDPATSDALFVRLPRRGPLAEVELAAGDRVRVTGKVLERNELTQLDRLEALEACGSGVGLEPTAISLPVPSRDAWESVEGMLVRFAEPPVVTEVYNLGRYGEVMLADARLPIATNVEGGAPDPALRRIPLGDGDRTENPPLEPNLARLLGPDGTLRVGDRLRLPQVVVTQVGLGAYELLPAAPFEVERVNERRAAPPPVGGDLRVAAMNVLNYFTSLNERGADSEAELERQTAKLVAALAAIDADALGLIEVENNGDAAAQALADALNARLGAGTYAVVRDLPQGDDPDQIRQAILYKPARLELVRAASDLAAAHDRPPVGATFRTEGGEVFSMAVVHFKSKGGCPATGDVDTGFGCWNELRTAQAEALAAFGQELARAAGDPDVLLLGDLNAYRMEPPVATLAGQGFLNLDRRLPPEERYTYVFFGESGTLDYALATTSLLPQVTGMANWHINADEPRAMDYDQDYNQPELYGPGPFRSSDHDPVIVGLKLR